MARCPIQPMIPVYLVVSGAFTILQTLLSEWKKRYNKEAVVAGTSPWHESPAQLNSLLNLPKVFLIAWWIVGAAYVFGWNKCSSCDRTTYLSRFGPYCCPLSSLHVVWAPASWLPVVQAAAGPPVPLQLEPINTCSAWLQHQGWRFLL